MKGLKMNSKTLSLLEENKDMSILERNNIFIDQVCDAYIVIDDEVKEGVIKEIDIEDEIEDYQEKIKVQQALFELSLTDTFSKENVEVIKAYIDKLERNQK